MNEKHSFLHFNFTDFLALGIILACFILIAMGKNSSISFVLVSVSSFYFGGKIKNR